MWILVLNDMRASNVENIRPVAKAETEELLLAFLEAEKVEGYQDGQWAKVFRQGGPLEWYNPPWDGSRHFQDIGTEDDWAMQSRQKYQELLAPLIGV